MTNDNIWHIAPVNDLQPHSETSSLSDRYILVNSEPRKIVLCVCACQPSVQYVDNDGVIIVHNAFDGREGLEWANEILNKD